MCFLCPETYKKTGESQMIAGERLIGEGRVTRASPSQLRHSRARSRGTRDVTREFPSAAVLCCRKTALRSWRSTFAHKMQSGGCQAVVATTVCRCCCRYYPAEGVTKFNWIYRSVFSFPFPARSPDRLAGRPFRKSASRQSR